MAKTGTADRSSLKRKQQRGQHQKNYLPRTSFHIKNSNIRFFLQEIRSTARTISPDFSSENALQSKMQQHLIFLQELIPKSRTNVPDFSPKIFFNQRCSSWFSFSPDLLNNSSQKNLAAAGPLSRTLSSFFSAASLSSYFLFSAVSLSSYFLGFLNASNSWNIFIPTSVLFNN